jgi:hypothetical protein
MALRKLCGRKPQFRLRDLDEYATSVQQDLEETTNAENAWQEVKKEEMPYGHRYFDWDEKLQTHRGIYIRQSADDDFDPEQESARPALPCPPPSPPASVDSPTPPGTSCEAVQAPAVEQNDSSGSDAAESDTLSNASTLVVHSQTPAAPAGPATQEEITLPNLFPITEFHLVILVVLLYLVSLQFRGFSWGVSAVFGFVLKMRWCQEKLAMMWPMLGRLLGRRDPGTDVVDQNVANR